MKPSEQRILNEAIIRLREEVETAKSNERRARDAADSASDFRQKLEARLDAGRKVMTSELAGTSVAVLEQTQEKGGGLELRFKADKFEIVIPVARSDKNRDLILRPTDDDIARLRATS